MKTVFIVNPAAGRGKAAVIWRELEPLARERFQDMEVLFTEGPLHATQIARENPDTKLIIVGGDGTFHEALQGLDGQVMGLIPAGTGNDLLKTLHIPRDPKAALERISAGNIKTIDVGAFKDRLFINGAGVGFEAYVTSCSNEGYKWIKGKGAYFLPLLQALFTFRGSEATVEADNYFFQGRLLTLTAGNGKYLGGGIKVVPQADIEDGKLSVCLIEDVSLFKRIRFLSLVLKGKHTELPFVHVFDTDRVVVKTSREFLVHGDGEIYGTTPVEFSILPQRLKILY